MKSGIGSIKTRRLELRPYLLSDHAKWAEGCRTRKPPQNDYDRGPPPAHKLTKLAFKKWLRSKDELQRRDLQYVYGIFDKKTQAHLGTIDFFILTRLATQTANLGYQIHNQYWGQGYAKEATKAAAILAFKKLRLHRLEAGIELGNRASVAVARSIGMKKEGNRKRFYFDGNRWLDIEMYVLTSENQGIRMKPTIRTEIGTYWIDRGPR